MITGRDLSRVSEVINSMAQEVRNLLKTAVDISYFSRGSVSYQEVLRLSALERDLWVEFINKRLEAAAKSPYPVY